MCGTCVYRFVVTVLAVTIVLDLQLQDAKQAIMVEL